MAVKWFKRFVLNHFVAGDQKQTKNNPLELGSAGIKCKKLTSHLVPTGQEEVGLNPTATRRSDVRLVCVFTIASPFAFVESISLSWCNLLENKATRTSQCHVREADRLFSVQTGRKKAPGFSWRCLKWFKDGADAAEWRLSLRTRKWIVREVQHEAPTETEDLLAGIGFVLFYFYIWLWTVLKTADQALCNQS